jgi:hypothetical protein
MAPELPFSSKIKNIFPYPKLVSTKVKPQLPEP